MTGEVCTDNRFILITKFFELLKERTNIETSYEEMQVIGNVLFRFWQCGWLDTLEKERDGTLVEVVRCKDCKHRPYSTEPGKTYGLTIEAPNDMCPCYNEDDGWYSWVPDNEFFCSYGERKEDEDGQLQDQD